MAAPVYRIVFHEEHWRIGFEGLHIGEYKTAQAAAEAALGIAKSRITPSRSIHIATAPNGEVTVGDSRDIA
jgi:hypothetical protein